MPYLKGMKWLQENVNYFWDINVVCELRVMPSLIKLTVYLLILLPVLLPVTMHSLRQPPCVAAGAAAAACVARCIVVCVLKGSCCTGIWRIRRCPPSLTVHCRLGLAVQTIALQPLRTGCKVTFGPVHHLFITGREKKSLRAEFIRRRR